MKKLLTAFSTIILLVLSACSSAPKIQDESHNAMHYAIVRIAADASLPKGMKYQLYINNKRSDAVITPGAVTLIRIQTGKVRVTLTKGVQSAEMLLNAADKKSYTIRVKSDYSGHIELIEML
jgi:outer membrane lipopolysaccharide assembly protein LptE/RlpB